MRALLRPFLTLGLVVALLLTACSNDDDHGGPAAPGPTGPAEALAGYWEAGDVAGAALAAADGTWETFAALAADVAAPADTVLAAARAYAHACSLAAVELAAWEELELSITSVQGVKSEIDEAARDAARATLADAREATRDGGSSLVLAWRTLGGLTSLRAALAAPDCDLPVTGRLADALAARLDARDAAVVDAIMADDDRDGLLPLTDLPGATPDARAAAYADLDPDDPLKLACRAAVPRWSVDERDASLQLLARAGRGRLRWFAGTGTGGASLQELPAQLTAADEDGSTTHAVTLDLRDGASGEPLTGHALVLLQRLRQPDEEPRLALLADAASLVTAEVPAGIYRVLALADGWARAVLPDVAVAADRMLQLDLTHLESGAILCDGIDAPAMAGAGGRVDLTVAAASAIGEPLDFAWDVQGPQVDGLLATGARCAFTPLAAGDYTVSLTVSDGAGNARRDSTTIAVKPFAVSVFRTEFLSEQVVDLHLNPGETDTLQLWIANRGEQEVVGQASLTGRDGVVAEQTSGTWTLGAGRQTRWKVPVTLPVDYDRERAHLDFAFTVDGETLVQELEYRVDFYVELGFIRSPVTSRILNVSGVVANPSLPYVDLIIDRDRESVYTLPLADGVFEQVVILPGSQDTRRVRVEVAAEAGALRAEASAGFMAAITPADFRATLFWDTDDTDVDLWVTDPDGERCYYANPATVSGLELDVDDVTGFGPENITGESDLPSGEYLVQVHYYSDHETDLASECTVLVTLHEGTPEETVATYTQTLSDGEVWTVCTVDWLAKAAAALRDGGQIASAPANLPAK
jgi:hypothetical protein